MQDFFLLYPPPKLPCTLSLPLHMEYFKIGKLAASHGLDGTLVLQHSLGSQTDLAGLKALFLEEGADNFIPYFIESFKVKNEDQVFIKLEGIDSKEAARKYTPRHAWMQETDFKKYTAKSAPIVMLGFMAMDGNEKIGEVIEVIEQPHQVLCTVVYKGKEIYLPVHVATLKKLDLENKILYLELPDGLLDIYS